MLAEQESTRVFALVTAMEALEITLQEFSDAVEVLTPEAMQVTATLLLGAAEHFPELRPTLIPARRICHRRAMLSRCLS